MSQQANELVKQRIEDAENDEVDFDDMVELLVDELEVADKTAASYIYDSSELEHVWDGDDHLVREMSAERSGGGQSVLTTFDEDGPGTIKMEPGTGTGKKYEELEILNDVGHPLVPDEPTYFRRRIEGHKSDVQLLTRDLSHDTPKGVKNVLLEGRPGVGKNAMAKDVCANTNRPHIRIPVGSGIRYEDLVGHYTPTPDGGLEWKDGMLTTAVRYGYVVVFDEIDMATGDITSPLHQITEEPGDRELVVRQTGEVIEPHPEFRVIATKNDGLAGAKQMNAAFRDRFSEMEVPYLTEEAEVNVLTNAVDGLTEDEIRPVIQYANDLRGRYPQELSTPVTTRMILSVADYIADGFLDTKAALRKDWLPKFDQQDSAALEDEIDMRF